MKRPDGGLHRQNTAHGCAGGLARLENRIPIFKCFDHIIPRHAEKEKPAVPVNFQGKKIELSKNEFKILHYLFQNTGRIIPRIELIEYLWDNQVFIDDNALSVNMTRLRGKLEHLGVQNFVETKRGMGYRL